MADNDAGDYAQPSHEVSAISFFYEYSWGRDLHVKGQRVASDYDVNYHDSALKFVTYRRLGEQLYAFVVGLPFAAASLRKSSDDLDLAGSGIGDPVVLAGFWPYTNKEIGLQWGVSGWVTLPLGAYDQNKPINAGQNRWVFKPETNLTFTPVPGISMEATVALQLFTDNTAFTPADLTLSRAPLLTVEGHVSKQVTDDLNLSLDYFFHGGGETSIAGIAQNNPKKDHALQTTATFPVGKDFSMRLLYRNDFHVENSFQTQMVGFRIIRPF
ncbi:MAG: transporter [Magnetococcales bacterium]|nr:transporter [Magnetococcales bacterium]